MISGVNGHNLRNSFPIALRLFNLGWRECLGELLVMGAITRMGVGLLRIEENVPTQSRKPKLTREEKWASLLERVFMEGVGVPAQVLSTYFLAEPVAKLFEYSGYLKFPGIKEGIKNGLPRHESNILSEIMQKVFAEPGSNMPKNIVGKGIFEWGTIINKTNQVKNEFLSRCKAGITSGKLIEGAEKVIRKYQIRIGIASIATFIAGILGGAILTGYVMQWLNDYPLSRKVIPWILNKFGIEYHPSEAKPASSGVCHLKSAIGSKIGKTGSIGFDKSNPYSIFPNEPIFSEFSTPLYSANPIPNWFSARRGGPPCPPVSFGRRAGTGACPYKINRNSFGIEGNYHGFSSYQVANPINSSHGTMRV